MISPARDRKRKIGSNSSLEGNTVISVCIWCVIDHWILGRGEI